MQKMTMPITIQGRLDQFQDRDFIVTCNPKGDGNCQFSALSNLLNRIGLHTSPRILRQNVVKCLKCNPANNVGKPLQLFLRKPSDLPPWNGARWSFWKPNTLQAISNIYTIQTYVLSTLAVGADVDIQPHINGSDNVQSYPQVFLGHCAKVQVEDYVALSKKLEDHIDFFSNPKELARGDGDEIWEITFKMIFQCCVYEWPHHICSVFNTLYNTCDICNIDWGFFSKPSANS